MKKSTEWVRQPALDKMLDQLVEDRGCTPAELNIYDAAKVLEIEPNGEFYKKVRDWKKRRTAESERPTVEVPAHVHADLQAMFDQLSSDGMSRVLRAVGELAGVANRHATSRIADAERQADDARAEVDELVDRWTDAETKRDAAFVKIDELEADLADVLRREERLLIRLEERDRLLDVLEAKLGGKVGLTVISATDSPEKPSDTAVDPIQEGQREIPFDTSADDDRSAPGHLDEA